MTTITGRGHQPADTPAAGRQGVVAALVLIGGYMIVEVVAGFMSGSLALLAHAGHMEELDGVTVIHDVHCWTLAPRYVVLTGHMLVDPAYAADGGHEILLDRVRDIAYDEFDIQHITVQLETTAGRCLEAHHVDHLLATARTPL